MAQQMLKEKEKEREIERIRALNRKAGLVVVRENKEVGQQSLFFMAPSHVNTINRITVGNSFITMRFMAYLVCRSHPKKNPSPTFLKLLHATHWRSGCQCERFHAPVRTQTSVKSGDFCVTYDQP